MKKQLSVFLVCIMLFTMTQISAFAASFTDTEGANCETAVEVLAAFGIVEGKGEGAYEPQSNLTRAEMATIILRAMDVAKTATGKDVFADVPASHWAYAYVGTAHQLGIVNGTSEQTFSPDDSVTYEQAVKMVTSALGYSVQAEALGGYPAGYLTKASQLGILKGVPTDKTMTRGAMAILLYNALDTPLAERASYGNDDLKFNSDEDITLLTRYLKANKAESKIVQTPMYAATETPKHILGDEAVIVIDGKNETVKAGKVDVDALFAVPSDIYYKEDEITGKNILVTVVPFATVETLTLVGRDINLTKTTTSTLFYEENKVEKKQNITGATLVFNGRVTELKKELLAPEKGSIKLISKDGIKYETIIVESYKNYFVDSVLVDENMVYFKNGAGSMEINLGDGSVATILTDDKDRPLTLWDVLGGDILSIAQDNDVTPSRRRIYRTYATVEGEITELDKTDKTAVINGKTYGVGVDFKEISLGKAGVFRLDHFDTIVKVEDAVGTMRNYAWLKNAGYTEGFSSKAQLYVFTSEGEWKLFETADVVSFNGLTVQAKNLLKNGVNADNAFDADTAPTLVDSAGLVIPQLISYKLNDAGLLCEVETAVNKSRLDTPATERAGGGFSLDYYLNYEPNAQGKNYPKNRMFNGTPKGSTDGLNPNVYDTTVEYKSNALFSRVAVADGTPYFIIPHDLNDEQGYDISTATREFGGFEMFRSVSENACHVIYDVNDTYTCGVVVKRGDFVPESSGGGSTAITYPDYKDQVALVLGFSKVVNEKTGEIEDVIRLKNKVGQDVSAVVKEGTRFLYRNANARLWDRTVTENGQTVTLPGDPDWYMLKADGTKYQPAQTAPEIKSGNTRTPYMYLDAEDIDPGDLLQYTLNADGTIRMGSVSFRVNYPGDIEMSTYTGAVSATAVDENYRGGNLQIYGKVVKTAAEGALMVEVNLAEGDGHANKSTIVKGLPSGVKTLRRVPSYGYFYLWDTKEQQMRQATVNDIVIGDTILSWWTTLTHEMVVIYR